MRKPPTYSAADVDVDVKVLSEHLGKEFDECGKKYVVDTIAGSKRRVTFSKMIGMMRWSNAIMLWVNVNKDENFNNVFSKNKKDEHFMTFYASKSMKPKSLLVRKVIETTTDPNQHILLMCRWPRKPYVFCGRCKCVTYKLDEQPIYFNLQLLDGKKVHQSCTSYAELF